MQNRELHRPMYMRSEVRLRESDDSSGLKQCIRCRALYQKRAWHHDTEKAKLEREKRHLAVEHIMCPACKMIARNQYEGKLVIEGVPSHYTSQLVDLIISVSRKARRKDPEDRLIEMRKKDNSLVLTTTENELAVRLAKKVRDVFKKVDLDVHYGDDRRDKTMVWARFNQSKPTLVAS